MIFNGLSKVLPFRFLFLVKPLYKKYKKKNTGMIFEQVKKLSLWPQHQL